MQRVNQSLAYIIYGHLRISWKGNETTSLSGMASQSNNSIWMIVHDRNQSNRDSLRAWIYGMKNKSRKQEWPKQQCQQ